MGLYDSIANDYLLNDARNAAFQSQADFESALKWGDWLLEQLFIREGQLTGERHVRMAMQQLLYDVLGDQVMPSLKQLGVQLKSVQKQTIAQLEPYRVHRQVPDLAFYRALRQRAVAEARQAKIFDVEAYHIGLAQERRQAEKTVDALGVAEARIRELEAQLAVRDKSIAGLQAKLESASGQVNTVAAAGNKIAAGAQVLLADYRWKLLRKSALAAALARDLKKVDPQNVLLTKGGEAQVGMVAELQYKREHWRSLSIPDTDLIIAEGKKFGEAFEFRPLPTSAGVASLLQRMRAPEASRAMPAAGYVAVSDRAARQTDAPTDGAGANEAAHELEPGSSDLDASGGEALLEPQGLAHSDNDEHDDQVVAPEVDASDSEDDRA